MKRKSILKTTLEETLEKLKEESETTKKKTLSWVDKVSVTTENHGHVTPVIN